MPNSGWCDVRPVDGIHVGAITHLITACEFVTYMHTVPYVAQYRICTVASSGTRAAMRYSTVHHVPYSERGVRHVFPASLPLTTTVR